MPGPFSTVQPSGPMPDEPIPLLDDWSVDPYHPDGVAVELILGGRPVRFVAGAVELDALVHDLRIAAGDRFSQDHD